MVAAIGGIGSANQNVKWGRPAQDPQQAHFEASKAMKERANRLKCLSTSSGQSNCNNPAKNPCICKHWRTVWKSLRADNLCRFTCRLLPSGLSKQQAARPPRSICRRRSQRPKEHPPHTTHPAAVVRDKNPVALSNLRANSTALFTTEIDITRHHRHLAH